MNILSYLHFSRERGREWRCCSVPYVGNVLSWASHWSLPAEWTSAVKQGFLLQPFKYHLFCSAPQCKYPNDDSLNICLAGQCKYSSINSLKNCSASQFKYPNQYLFSTTMQISKQWPNQYLFSPTMHVFDRRAKLLQRERAAANKEVEKFDFLKEEVPVILRGRIITSDPQKNTLPPAGGLQGGRQGAWCCEEDGGCCGPWQWEGMGHQV